jgi:hypothetical protein
MRARSREVNIFNMSLLDILTGMLGAFLFLMLGLVPYYNKAQNQKDNGSNGGPQTPQLDTMLNIISRWDSSAKVDFLFHGPNGWRGANAKSVPLSSRVKITTNVCPASDTWAMTSQYVSAGNRYLLCISPQGPTDPESLRHIRYSVELLEAESSPDGSGLKSYYPAVVADSYDASGAKPGYVYGVFWVDVTKDTSKTSNPDDFNLQYDYACTPVKAGDSLPDGAVVLPPGAPITAESTPSPTPAPTPNSSTPPPPTPAAPPEKPSMWNPFNWFRSSTPPAQK